MKTYKAIFYGKPRESISILQNITVLIVEKNEDLAKIKLQNDYEYIGRLQIKEIKKEV